MTKNIDTTLIEAIEEGDLEIVKLLHGFHINDSKESYYGYVFACLQNDDKKMLCYLNEKMNALSKTIGMIPDFKEMCSVMGSTRCLKYLSKHYP